MKRTLQLSSFDVRPSEPVSLHLIEGQPHGARWRRSRVRSQAAVRSWPWRAVGILGNWCWRRANGARGAAMIAVLMLAASHADAALVRRPQFWAEGIIVSADLEHHMLNLAVRGRRFALLSWNQTTQQVDRRTAGQKGQAVDAKSLQINRAVRVLVERHGPQLVAKKIILLSSVQSPRVLSIPGALA